MTSSEQSPPAQTGRLQRPHFYFGWYIVIGALLAQMMQAGLSVYAGGVFLVPMTEDLDWSRTEFTLAQTVGQVVTGAVSFFVGAYVDRYGGRRLMLIGGTLVAATMLAISEVQELWQWLLLRGLLFMAGAALMGNLVVNVTLSKWFVELRGRAIGIGAVGFSLGSIFIAPPLTVFVDEFGWRAGWQILAVVAIVVIFPVALLMRRQPEDHGMHPDGRSSEELLAGAANSIDADYYNSFTRREALRTPALYMITIAFGVAVIGIGGIILNTIPFLTDQGYSRGTASLIVTMLGITAGGTKPFWGWLTERYDSRYIAAIGFIIAGISMILIVVSAASGNIQFVAFAYLLWGAGIGALFPTQEIIWAQYFGRRYLGQVRSVVLPVSLTMGAIGPLVTNLYFDTAGNYDGVFIVIACNWLLAALLVLAVRRPHKPQRLLITHH